MLAISAIDSLAALAVLSLSLVLWQWLAARRFPLHQRIEVPEQMPGVTLLKSLKGQDKATEACLRSWFEQDYAGPVQILFAVASADDPVCPTVRKLLEEFRPTDSRLVVCPGPLAANAKISKLAELEGQAKHEIIVISDADVRVPRDLLAQVVQTLSEPGIALVHCFYRLANPGTAAMQWEAVAINADFWSQVLQAASLGPVKFAMGAVMATRRRELERIGGLRELRDCLADDYQLGNRIARNGGCIEFCRVVVDCWSSPMSWAEVWKHQLRWARTIRVSQPLPYFFSILSNGTLWPLLWLGLSPAWTTLTAASICWCVRIAAALNLQARLAAGPAPLRWGWLIPLKDLLQAAVWLLAFCGSSVEWRGEILRLRRDGTLVKASDSGRLSGAGGNN
jgi:ceramide glucosyltransferase